MRGFMQKPCLRLLAGFAFAQIMFLGNESPFAMKHQRPVCHLVEAREKARWMHGRPAEVGFNACRPTAFWGDGVSGRRLELAMQLHGLRSSEVLSASGRQGGFARGSKVSSPQTVCRNLRRDGKVLPQETSRRRGPFQGTHCVCAGKDKAAVRQMPDRSLSYCV